MDRESSFVYGAGDAVEVITNADLQCADCIYALPQGGICQKFRPKPAEVLYKTGYCPEYEPKDKSKGVVFTGAGDRVDNGVDDRIVFKPQCVDCAENQGGRSCRVLAIKPERFLDGSEDCPFLRKGGT